MPPPRVALLRIGEQRCRQPLVAEVPGPWRAWRALRGPPGRARAQEGPTRLMMRYDRFIALGPKRTKLNQKSEPGHVHHVSKAPSEGEIRQKTKDLPSVDSIN